MKILGVTHTAPAFEVPRGACDCHVHVFGPAEQFPFSAGRKYTPGPASLEELLALHHVLGLERVVSCIPRPMARIIPARSIRCAAWAHARVASA